MRLIRTGTWSRIEEARDREGVYRLIDRDFAYKVEGYFWSPAYKARRWDGKTHLIRKVRGGGLTFPSGLFREVKVRLDAAGYEYDLEDHRRSVPLPGIPDWIGHDLRPYQEDAVRAAIKRSGIIRLPVRSGKTLIATRIIRALGQRAVILVPSDLLETQTIKAVRKCLRGAIVTPLRMGDDREGEVVVTTIQALVAHRKSKRFVVWGRRFGVLFIDECHHMTNDGGNAWRDIALGIDAGRKYGLTGTAKVHKKKENPKGDIWLRGLCGRFLISRTISDMIDGGYLAPLLVRFVAHGAPMLPGRKWGPEVYNDGIVGCEPRNKVIRREAVQYVRNGSRVLVDVARIKHTQILHDMIAQHLPHGQVVILKGETSKAVRERALQGFKTGQVRMIVGTIMGEGIDVPSLDVVVNAEGGKAPVSMIQRLRNLTTYDGKSHAEVVELIDDHHDVLRKWTLKRLKIYRAEPAFKIRVER